MSGTTIRIDTAIETAPRRSSTRGSMHLALVWSALTVLAAVTWATDLVPHPFGDPGAVGFGAVFNAFDPLVGTAFVLVLGLIGVGCALSALHHPVERRGGTVVAGLAWLLAAVITLVLLHGQLLVMLGYLPVLLTVGWFDGSLWGLYLEQLGDPGTIFQLYALAGALLWGVAALHHRRRRAGACPDCGRTHGWTDQHETRTRHRALRIGRIAVTVAVGSALIYPAARLPWLFGVPVGMSADSWDAIRAEPGAVATGVTLGLAGIVGATLMVGLIRDWGVRFPAWMVGLAGRRVPPTMAVAPATIVAIALVALGRGIIPTLVSGDLPFDLGTQWVHALSMLSMLPWGVALGVATAAYAVRRRADCATCDLGWPEQRPALLRRDPAVPATS